MKTDNRKLFHLHLKDSMENKSTLICRLTDGNIRYTYYQGTGSSGMGYALSNIQLYDRVNGNMHWNKKSLPIENLENETLIDFKHRVINILNNSTNKVVRDVNVNVNFK